MVNVWQKKQLDLDILELLYNHYCLRGKTIADLIQVEIRQKIYDRLYALGSENKKGLGLISAEKFTGMNLYQDQTNKKTRGLRLGSMYYLTQSGAEVIYKHIYNKPLPPDIRFKKPSPEALYSCYHNSLILENIDLPFQTRKQFRESNEVHRSYITDLVYQHRL